MLKILFATDGSQPANDARTFLEALPLEGAAEIRLVAVIPPAETGFQQGRRAYELADSAQRSWADWVLAEAGRPFLDRGVSISTDPRAGQTDQEIIEAARQWEADLVVIGAHGLTGLRAFLLGSTARNVAHRAACSVLVARAPRGGLREIVLGTDGSDHASGAAAALARLPLPPSSRITAAAVARPYQVMPSVLMMDTDALEEGVAEVRDRQVEECRRLAAEAAGQLAGAGRQADTAGILGDPATELLALVEARQADLLVVGARGVSALEGLLVGSVADRVLGGAACSVLIAR